jgi:hypothetical protein
MTEVWIVVSNNDLGVDIHGVYTSRELADSISKQMNKENKAHVESTGFIYYGDRHYVISGNVNDDPKHSWGC